MQQLFLRLDAFLDSGMNEKMIRVVLRSTDWSWNAKATTYRGEWGSTGPKSPPSSTKTTTFSSLSVS